MVRQVAVPPEARALSTLPGIDYADAFVVEIRLRQGRMPEQWLRAMLEGAPLRTRKALRLGWRALGLRIGSESAGELAHRHARRAPPAAA